LLRGLDRQGVDARNGNRRSFRHMAFTQLKGLQAICAKSGRDTIDEGGERYILLPVPFEIALRRIEVLVTQHIQPQDFETIAGIEIVVHSLQALGKESGNAFGSRKRLRGACGNAKTLPSTRKSTSSKTRPPAPRASSDGFSERAIWPVSIRMSSSAPTGSIRRRSAERLAIGRRGEIGSSSVPSA
jgi:hypothetical protein